MYKRQVETDPCAPDKALLERLQAVFAAKPVSYTHLGTVLTEYEALVGKSFLDPLDDLTRLKNQLAVHPFFVGTSVAVSYTHLDVYKRQVFTPKHPRTRPVLKYVLEAEEKLDENGLMERAMAGIRWVRI